SAYTSQKTYKFIKIINICTKFNNPIEALTSAASAKYYCYPLTACNLFSSFPILAQNLEH
ncbi:hypothetical protein HZS_4366, partial [Henneguya salminicola]